MLNLEETALGTLLTPHTVRGSASGALASTALKYQIDGEDDLYRSLPLLGSLKLSREHYARSRHFALPLLAD
ncbi:hypothetical protein TRAPUB_10662 [Trametes pubescens]|uniref:Uncharacterized protein n=1 Tax=Trametes pubescens TaxID=154538 RepID=A0A1M2VYZ5_TRAPU|nr:hypothetical protein TRAPUB_10662 [Trametes pubescens]